MDLGTQDIEIRFPNSVLDYDCSILSSDSVLQLFLEVLAPIK